MPLAIAPAPDRGITITCDHDGCGLSITDDKIAASGGLIESGWLRRFNGVRRCNEYFCPQHKEEHRGY